MVADVNAKDKNGYSPLHKALVLSHYEIAELLVKNGANVNEKYPSGNTLLFQAYVCNQIKVFEFLYAHGARDPQSSRLCN